MSLSDYKERMQGWYSSKLDEITGAPWMQPVRSKWEDLGAENQGYVKLASLAFALILMTIVTFQQVSGTSELLSQMHEQDKLIEKLKEAESELRKLKAVTQNAAFQGSTVSWKQYVQDQSLESGLEESKVEFISEMPIKSNEKIEETVVTWKAQKLNVRQLVKYLYSLENAGQIFKLRKLNIQTDSDESGYLAFEASASGYRMKP